MRERKPPNDRFKIYVDQLKAGHVEKIKEEFSPEFLDVDEPGLHFVKAVCVQGEAYVAEGELVLHLDIQAEAEIPCRVCNEPVAAPVEIEGLYMAIPLSEVPSGVFSLVEPLREAILLETPRFAECSSGQCPERKSIEKFLKKQPTSAGMDDTYRPFEGLKSDDEGV